MNFIRRNRTTFFFRSTGFFNQLNDSMRSFVGIKLNELTMKPTEPINQNYISGGEKTLKKLRTCELYGDNSWAI